MFKKLIFSLLSGLVLFTAFVPNFATAYAQGVEAAPEGSWYNQDFQSWRSKVYDDTNPQEIFGERYTAAQVQWVIYGLFSFILNSTTNSQALSCVMSNSGNLQTCTDLLAVDMELLNTASIEQQEKESPSLASLVFEERAFSGIGYAKQKVRDFSLVPTVHAQAAGFGFDALLPIQGMWRASRDMAFGLFVVAAIIFSFMIMFRVKISPQVVISVQSAIPKLVIALVLVTFSYAIAGLLIDLMYVVYGIISVAGTGFVPFGNVSAPGMFQFLTKGQVGFGFLETNLGVIGLIAVYLILFPIFFIIALYLALGALISTVAAAITLLTPLSIVMATVGVLLLIIAIILTIWNSVKILWALLKAFVNILLLTIFAPLQIVAGTIIPGFGFGQWVKSFASNLAVYITTSLLFLFTYVFLLLGLKSGSDAVIGSSNILEGIGRFIFGTAITVGGVGERAGWPPLAGGAEGFMGLLLLGVSFVLFTLIPKATEIVQGLISGRPFAYGTAIGEAMTPITGPTKYVGGLAAREYGLPAIGLGAGYVRRRFGLADDSLFGRTLGQVERFGKGEDLSRTQRPETRRPGQRGRG
jgi:hypothetical protein